jgi:hypothetical protein
MMEKIEITVFSFDELGDDAKEVARGYFREHLTYPWFDEEIASIKAFCEHFGARLVDYQVGGDRGDFIESDATPAHFRGVKLKDIDPHYMPIGYCMDSDIWMHFHDVFKQSGNAFHSFTDTLEVARIVIERNVQHYFSDESIDEFIICNDYEFMEDGELFTYDKRRVA